MQYYETEPSKITHDVDPDPYEASDYLRIHVKKEKGVHNFVKEALKHFGPAKPVVFTGEGRNTTKTISCAEVMKGKSRHNIIHQNTKICEMRTVETWNPICEGLDPLQVVRTVPIIHIVISLEPLDRSDAGYQKNYQHTPYRVISEVSITPSSAPSSPILGSSL